MPELLKLHEDVLEMPNLALGLLKVYLFFQTEIWPWQYCFWNKSSFQNIQFEDPKPLACKSVPILVLNLHETIPQKWLRTCHHPCKAYCCQGRDGSFMHMLLRSMGLVVTLGALCHFLVFASLISNMSIPFSKIFL